MVKEKQAPNDAITKLKVELFDIMRAQETLQMQIRGLEQAKMQKVQELTDIEGTVSPPSSSPQVT